MDKKTRDIAALHPVATELRKAFTTLNQAVDVTDPKVKQALADLHTFCAIGVKVMARTNPRQLRLITEEVRISHLSQGGAVIEP